MKKFMEKLRFGISASGIHAVSAPYLPFGLIKSALLLVFTDLVVVLLGQSAGFWIDRSRATSSIPLLKDLLTSGLLLYALMGLIYLVLLGILLTAFTRSYALVIWMLISFVHLTHSLSWAVGKVEVLEAISDPLFAASINAISSLILGIILVIFLLNPKRLDHQQTSIRIKTQFIVPVVWVLALFSAVLVSALGPKGGWVLLQPEHSPGLRAISAVTYDSVKQKVVLFGGVSDWLGSQFLYENDTWEWNGEDWVEMHPQTTPPARAGHTMAFDENRGVIVMFGGEQNGGTYMLSDTWEWNGKNWRQIISDNYPQARRGGQLFYDPVTEKVILTGGFYYTYPDKVVTPLNDIWEWDGKNWQFITTTAETLMITNPNVAYDARRHQIVLYNYHQIVSWADGEWTEIAVDIKPPNRFGPWLAADPESGKMLMFGGVDTNIQRNDTWLLDGDVWQELQADLAPEPRDAHVMFYDPIRKSFIVYGGLSTYTLDDMWEFVLP